MRAGAVGFATPIVLELSMAEDLATRLGCIIGNDDVEGAGFLLQQGIAVVGLGPVAPDLLRRVRDFPANGEGLAADTPTAMKHVLVKGTPIRADGESLLDELDSLPGQIARVA